MPDILSAPWGPHLKKVNNPQDGTSGHVAPRTVFVMMPFGDPYDVLYQDIVKPTFEEAGYTVHRADDMDNQQSILSDIVSGILNADLLVADLTDGNPNVYYELGLAHASKKPVILISQDVDGTPFDLRSYRVIAYDLRFDRIGAIKERLKDLALKVTQGEVHFGNPMSDFTAPEPTPMDARPKEKRNSTPSSEEEEEEEDAESHTELGILDVVMRGHEGLEEVNRIVTEFTKHVEDVGQKTSQKSAQLQAAVSAGDVRGARDVVRELAQDYQKNLPGLRDLNRRFPDAWTATGSAFEMMLRHQSAEQRAETEAGVAGMAKVSRESREAIGGLARTMELTPPVERRFDRTKARLIHELKAFMGGLDEVSAFDARVGSILKTSE